MLRVYISAAFKDFDTCTIHKRNNKRPNPAMNASDNISPNLIFDRNSIQ